MSYNVEAVKERLTDAVFCEPLKEPMLLPCSHRINKIALERIYQMPKEPECPICRATWSRQKKAPILDCFFQELVNCFFPSKPRPGYATFPIERVPIPKHPSFPGVGASFSVGDGNWGRELQGEILETRLYRRKVVFLVRPWNSHASITKIVVYEKRPSSPNDPIRQDPHAEITLYTDQMTPLLRDFFMGQGITISSFTIMSGQYVITSQPQIKKMIQVLIENNQFLVEDVERLLSIAEHGDWREIPFIYLKDIQLARSISRAVSISPQEMDDSFQLTPMDPEILKEHLFCPMNKKPLNQAVMLFPCLHRVNEEYADTLSACPTCGSSIEDAEDDLQLREFVETCFPNGPNLQEPLYPIEAVNFSRDPNFPGAHGKLILSEGDWHAEIDDPIYSRGVRFRVETDAMESGSIQRTTLQTIEVFERRKDQRTEMVVHAVPEDAKKEDFIRFLYSKDMYFSRNDHYINRYVIGTDYLKKMFNVIVDHHNLSPNDLRNLRSVVGDGNWENVPILESEEEVFSSSDVPTASKRKSLKQLFSRKKK
jgi:hypothetical protein